MDIAKGLIAIGAGLAVIMPKWMRYVLDEDSARQSV